MPSLKCCPDVCLEGWIKVIEDLRIVSLLEKILTSFILNTSEKYCVVNFVHHLVFKKIVPHTKLINQPTHYFGRPLKVTAYTHTHTH
jgi:hypothetical protein